MHFSLYKRLFKIVSYLSFLLSNKFSTQSDKTLRCKLAKSCQIIYSDVLACLQLCFKVRKLLAWLAAGKTFNLTLLSKDFSTSLFLHFIKVRGRNEIKCENEGENEYLNECGTAETKSAGD